MKIETSRFGPVQLSTDDVLNFEEGLLGFSNLTKFVLLDDPCDEIFAWLQSCENSAVAFPVLEPQLFMPQYQVELTKGDLQNLQVSEAKACTYFTIITIPDDPTKMTANLKAPIAINVKARVARQCVLQDNNLAIREPIFTKLQQRVVQNPATSIKSQAFDTGVAVQLPKMDEIISGPDKGLD